MGFILQTAFSCSGRAIAPIDISDSIVINSNFHEPVFTIRFQSISTLLFGQVIQVINIIDYSPVSSMAVGIKKYIRRI